MRRPLGPAALLLLVALAGCAADEAGSEPGSASIYVKDAPTDEFQEIHLVFTQVEVHFAGNATGDGNATDGEDRDGNASGGAWRTVFASDGTDVDLLAASGNASAFLGEEDLEAGRYTQIRIHVASAHGIDHDNETVEIEVVGSPLKVVRSFEVEAGMESRIVIDFDLDRSLKCQGGGAGPLPPLPGQEPEACSWRLAPVVGKTTVTVVEDDESGSEADTEGEVVEET